MDDDGSVPEQEVLEVVVRPYNRLSLWLEYLEGRLASAKTEQSRRRIGRKCQLVRDALSALWKLTPED